MKSASENELTPVEQFQDLWKRGHAPDVFAFLDQHTPVSPREQLDVLLTDQYHRWKSGQIRSSEDYLTAFPEVAARADLVQELMQHEEDCRRENSNSDHVQGKTVLSKRRSVHNAEIREYESPRSQSLRHVADVKKLNKNEQAHVPHFIGRYQVSRELGSGSSGVVYLAHDPVIDRHVVLKVPCCTQFVDDVEIERFLDEARLAGRLKHPGLVAVYDAGRTDSGPFVVMEYVHGENLQSRLAAESMPVRQIAQLAAEIADALAHAHQQGLVHRDLKPANVLVDSNNRPRVADFGLAIHESVQLSRQGEIAGSPAYMSPEQIRGETHRLDGRTDIWALGVIMYEMLTGRRPFNGNNLAELFDEVNHREPRPLRQLVPSIPQELARICLKCLSKRMIDRYESATDLNRELTLWLDANRIDQSPSGTISRSGTAMRSTAVAGDIAESRSPDHASPLEPSVHDSVIRIMPKGLRSFTADDAEFFLKLLPGPRDRGDLPESIRFWKTWIETRDRDEASPVGLLYGPSGCGKSSLVKAGLLPRLHERVLPVLVETSGYDTECRLLKSLQREFPDVSHDLSLAETVGFLREKETLNGRKVLIVLDQFEQWLHAHRDVARTELVRALRQCDGEHVQALVLVRDDFWMAATRLMRALEIPLLEGKNSAAVDLFDLLHARKVLTAFGRAFGRLPESDIDLKSEQRLFLDQAVTGLSRDGKVICVHLSLFAEMVKGRPWTTATLRELGGTDGVGVTFLDETFCAQNAPPEHRLHQHAARQILRALIPGHGAALKGHRRSEAELRTVSGYEKRPDDFAGVMRILDVELRLITPTDGDGVPQGEPKEAGKADAEIVDDTRPAMSQGRSDCPSSKTNHTSADSHHAPSATRNYQLTHDYLVPSLRNWLTRRQRETRQGRSELTLVERCAIWSSKPQNRFLPNLREHLAITLWTHQRDWTPCQQRMMARSTRYHAIRGLIGFLVLLLGLLLGLQLRNDIREDRAADLVDQLKRRETATAAIPQLLEELDEYRPDVNPLLREELENVPDGSPQQLHLRLALFPVDKSQSEYLFQELLRAKPEQFPVIRDVLKKHGRSKSFQDRLWAIALNEDLEAQQRLRASAALALYSPRDSRWQSQAMNVAVWLVQTLPSDLAVWQEAFFPVRRELKSPLLSIFRDPLRDDERDSATALLKHFSEDNGTEMCQLLLEVDVQKEKSRFADLFAVIDERHRRYAVRRFEHELTLAVAASTDSNQREAHAKRQANAAVALVMMGDDQKVWPLLRHRADPRLRSHLLHRLAWLGADPQLLADQLESETDNSVRRAIILCLGESSAEKIDPPLKQQLIELMLDLYQNDPDPGLHSATQWALNRWHQQTELDRADGDLATGRMDGNRRWYLTTQQQTFAIHQFRENGRRTLAAAATEITIAEIRRFYSQELLVVYEPTSKYGWTEQSPAHGMSFQIAARYCNWLSEQEGLPPIEWCYEEDETGHLRPAADFQDRTGYRLPTEREWEFLCRAETDTQRYYGDGDELLPHFACFSGNSHDAGFFSVGSLKPNDFGLFDTLGNVYEWCHSDAVNTAEGDALFPIAMRGGAFCYPAPQIHAHDGNEQPREDYRVGFRPVRTMR